MEETELYNVHRAISEAQQESKEEYAEKDVMETFTFRIHEQTRDAAKGILSTHGINLSQFCRKCVEGLVKDYKP